MLGGAGGAYTTLFSNFEIYYKLLYDFIKEYNFISGIDLDVEEFTDINNIKLLIRRLKKDFGSTFIITMAPVASSMIYNGSSLGGFSYKKLYNSDEGKLIDWFNVQCYGCYNLKTFSSIINNLYPANKIVLGMLGDEYTNNTLPNAIKNIKEFYNKYNTLAGCILWEYGDTHVDPILWGKNIININ